MDIVCVGISLNQLDPLSPSLATDARVLKRWQDWIDRYFQPFQRRLNKPFLANENGCFPVAGALVWGAYNGIPKNPVLDLSQMTRYYLLQSEAFGTMQGYYGPGWFAYAFDPHRPGGIRDPEWNARLKVEDVIREIFGGPPEREPIRMDGSIADWAPYVPIASDPVGDQNGDDDLVALYATEGERYFYFRLDYGQSATGQVQIGLDTDGDGGADFTINATALYTWNHTWQALLLIPRNRLGPEVGVVDVVDAGFSLEMRIHKRYLAPELGRPVLCSVQVYDSSWSVMVDELPGCYPIPERQ